MRNQCKCKLPYVYGGTDNCTKCGNHQARFLAITDKRPITLKKEFKGDEFKSGDIVEVIGKSYACLVEIVNYLPKGGYRIQLPNGCFHDTQVLGLKVKQRKSE